MPSPHLHRYPFINGSFQETAILDRTNSATCTAETTVTNRVMPWCGSTIRNRPCNARPCPHHSKDSRADHRTQVHDRSSRKEAKTCSGQRLARRRLNRVALLCRNANRSHGKVRVNASNRHRVPRRKKGRKAKGSRRSTRAEKGRIETVIGVRSAVRIVIGNASQQ